MDGVNKRDGNNVLHIAVSENAEELVSLLLSETTIDVTRKNNADQMPIEIAMAAEVPNRKILHLLKGRYDQVSHYDHDNIGDELCNSTCIFECDVRNLEFFIEFD